MASVDTGGGEAKKGKPKKQILRVDFTPMVDMNMLLITFFMFCTTLSKPQTMDIVLPTKDDKQITDDMKNKVKESTAITLILGEDHKIYAYEGKPDFEDYKKLQELTYSTTKEGGSLRELLLKRNQKTVEKMTELKIQKAKNQLTAEKFDEEVKKLRNDEKDPPVVIIKPTDASTYKNLVDALDEMQICSIGKYAVVELADADAFVVQNYKEKGALSAQAPPAKK